MTGTFDNRTAIVTGGASGLGEAYARAFAERGANVVVADIIDDRGRALVDDLRRDGHPAMYLHVDVSDEKDTARLAPEVIDEFGAIDILVNNAALYTNIEKKRLFDEIPVSEWDRMMAVNVRGVWLCTRAVVAVMRRAWRGKIVNIASAVVHAGVPNFAHYSASKGAIIAFTRSVARELGPHNINVNAIAPGLVDNEASRKVNTGEYMERATTVRAIRRAMVAQDLVGTVLFLASKDSDFITGQTFVVDGGAVMQ